MIKPDAVKRHLISKLIGAFEQRGYKLVAMKLLRPNTDLLNKHYNEITETPFFSSLLRNMQSGPVVPMVWEGKDIVNQGRVMIGHTDPLLAARGTLRGDLSIDVNRNIVHGSDSIENAEKEIKLWFTEEELIDWDDPSERSVYELEED